MAKALGAPAPVEGEARAAPADALRVADLHKRFGDLEVLRGVSLTAYEHDVIAILGASGSGKSTLLRCINLLEIPDSGEVHVAGELIRMKAGRRGRAMPADRRQVDRIRARLGMVFQQFNLWSHMNVLQNVIEAPVHVLKKTRREAEATERGKAILDKVGLERQAGLLSRRTSRAASSSAPPSPGLSPWIPTCMLFDEPTSALDPELVGEVLAG